MKEIIAFSVLIISVVLFSVNYKPDPVVIEKMIEKPIVVEKIIEKPVIIREECAIRDSPVYKPKPKPKQKTKKDFLRSYQKNNLQPCE